MTQSEILFQKTETTTKRGTSFRAPHLHCSRSAEQTKRNYVNGWNGRASILIFSCELLNLFSILQCVIFAAEFMFLNLCIDPVIKHGYLCVGARCFVPENLDETYGTSNEFRSAETKKICNTHPHPMPQLTIPNCEYRPGALTTGHLRKTDTII